MNNLSEQVYQIVKAQGFDILKEQVKELKQVIIDLIDKGDLNDLEFTNEENTNDFKNTLNKAKMLLAQSTNPFTPKDLGKSFDKFKTEL